MAWDRAESPRRCRFCWSQTHDVARLWGGGQGVHTPRQALLVVGLDSRQVHQVLEGRHLRLAQGIVQAEDAVVGPDAEGDEREQEQITDKPHGLSLQGWA